MLYKLLLLSQSVYLLLGILQRYGKHAVVRF